MKLFKIELTDVGYDDYSGAVICVETERMVRPINEVNLDKPLEEPM